jgi:hypothetical protein
MRGGLGCGIGSRRLAAARIGTPWRATMGAGVWGVARAGFPRGCASCLWFVSVDTFSVAGERARIARYKVAFWVRATDVFPSTVIGVSDARPRERRERRTAFACACPRLSFGGSYTGIQNMDTCTFCTTMSTDCCGTRRNSTHDSTLLGSCSRMCLCKSDLRPMTVPHSGHGTGVCFLGGRWAGMMVVGGGKGGVDHCVQVSAF